MDITGLKSIVLTLRLVGVSPVDILIRLSKERGRRSRVAPVLHFCCEHAAFKLHSCCAYAANSAPSQLGNAAKCNIMQHIFPAEGTSLPEYRLPGPVPHLQPDADQQPGDCASDGSWPIMEAICAAGIAS